MYIFAMKKGTAFLALSLREAGYSVWANHDASGTTSLVSRDMANLGMHDAGVHVVSLWVLLSHLFRDWRNPDPSVDEVLPYIRKYFPESGIIMESHEAAVGNATDA
jgi:hypothetical protein